MEGATVDMEDDAVAGWDELEGYSRERGRSVQNFWIQNSLLALDITVTDIHPL